MASDKQIAANRLNAQKSTGPRSAAGKSQSAQNSRKHGFCTSNCAVAHLEDLDEIVNLRQDLIDLYHPANSQELWAVERIALHQMSLIRASRLEAGLFTNCLDQALGSDGQPIHPMNEEMAGLGKGKITFGQEHNFAIAASLHRMTQRPHTWALFLRYQAQAERNYRRAIQEFERLRALRSEFEEELEEIPNEPNSPPQPEATEPDPSPETSPIPDVGQAPSPARDPLVALPSDATIPCTETNPIPLITSNSHLQTPRAGTPPPA
ncbi:MAG: hypothetical protein ABSB88_25390 [Bryobacteraceae bacterium]|jgi:hypothetical protein